MPTVKVDWSGGWRFDGYDSKSMPVDIDGRQSLGVKPSDLLPIALAACSGVDLVMLFDEGDAALTGLSIEASFTQQADPPWTFERVRMHYVLTGRGIAEDDAAEAIRRSEEELCSVAATLRGTATIESTFEIVAG